MNLRYIPIAILENTQNGLLVGNGFKWVGQFFMLIIVFVGVVLLAHYTTKWLASSKNMFKNGNMQIIESMGVGNQSSVQIIKVGNKYFLLGVTKENVSMLTEIDEESIEVNTKKNTMEIDFKSFDNYLKKQFSKITRNGIEIGKGNNTNIDANEKQLSEKGENEESEQNYGND